MQSFDNLAILSQSNLILLIAVGTGVPRQPVDCIDCDVIVDLHRDCRADRLEIALIWSRIVDYPGLGAILCGLAIALQFNSIVKIAVRIAVLIFWVDCDLG